MSRGAAIDPTLADVERARQRALMIQVAQHGEEDLAELRELLRTAGVAGAGELDELKRAIKASDANLVACDDELLPRQERNLEDRVGVPVIDRTAIILDIFADHAHTAEDKLQV